MAKIRGTKPTREERKFLMKNKLDTYMWLVQSNNTNTITVIHRETGEVKTLNK